MKTVFREPQRFSQALVLWMILEGSTAANAFELRRHVASGGAVNESGGSFQLKATVGESVVSGMVMGGSFSLGEGFWPGLSGSPAVDAPPPVVDLAQPLANALGQNMPNPFRGPTTIAFDISSPSAVRLVIYDVSGRNIQTVTSGDYGSGRYRVDWDGRDESGRSVAGGVYFYRLDIGSWSQTRKMLKLH